MNNPDMLLAVLTFFVAISGVALLIQAALLFGIYKTTKAIQTEALSICRRRNPFWPRQRPP